MTSYFPGCRGLLHYVRQFGWCAALLTITCCCCSSLPVYLLYDGFRCTTSWYSSIAVNKADLNTMRAEKKRSRKLLERMTNIFMRGHSCMPLSDSLLLFFYVQQVLNQEPRRNSSPRSDFIVLLFVVLKHAPNACLLFVGLCKPRSVSTASYGILALPRW